jgi:hypothetical protein
MFWKRKKSPEDILRDISMNILVGANGCARDLSEFYSKMYNGEKKISREQQIEITSEIVYLFIHIFDVQMTLRVTSELSGKILHQMVADCIPQVIKALDQMKPTPNTCLPGYYGIAFSRSTYEQRTIQYRAYPRLWSYSNEDSVKDTLLWEFALRISILISGERDGHIAIFLSGLLMIAMSLWIQDLDKVKISLP